MAGTFENALASAKRKLGIGFDLKDRQLETLDNLYGGYDCVSVLPTGYGKSVIFQLLPWLLGSESGIVLVVSPLTSLMQDQVMSLSEKDIKACFLNSDGNYACDYAIVCVWLWLTSQ
jgi:superfamily II DNA helicase RecQ